MRSNVRINPLLFLVVSLVACGAAFGQLTPSQDSYTNTADPTTNYGAQKLLDVESSQTTYIQFDLSAIPSGYTGANITKASLKLYVNTVTKAGSFNVDYVNGAWSESTITANTAPALGTTIAASVPLTTADKNQYIVIDITPAVQAWLNGTANDGIALVGNSPVNATFDSKESTTTSHSAELDIVFAGGGGSGITGIDTASGSGLIGGGTSGTLNLSLTNTCATNQVLQWNGSAWICASVGTGTITGVTAGTDLTGGGTSGNVTLNLNTANVPQLNTANTFTGNQTVNGNLSATGVVTGSAYQIGSNLFGFGSYATKSAYMGFAGNTTTTGIGNTASGYLALEVNSSGYANTASGTNALQSNTSGDNNTASGVFALSANTTGYENTASGSGALYYNTTGNWNTAIGGNSGYTTSGVPLTGSYNTAVGAAASFVTSSLQNATAIGSNAIVNSSNSTAIGAYSYVSESNAMVLGEINGVNGAMASTNVGIGTSAPISVLDVDANAPSAAGPSITITNLGGGASASATLDFNSYAPSSTGTYNPAARIAALDAGNFSDNLRFRSNIPGAANNGLQTNMTILSTGQVGIGTESPDDLLSVNGSADKPGGGSWGTFSDSRLKTVNGSFGSGLNEVLKLHPIRYRYKPGNAMGIRDTDEHIGVVAQEVRQVIPEAVTENGQGYLLVNNDPIIWSMLNAIKEQQGEFRQQQAELAKALRQIKQQQSLLRAQSSSIQRLEAKVRDARETVKQVKMQLAHAETTMVAAK